jgi:hypothetical protein
VIISEFKPGSNPTAIQITNNAVTYMQSQGFEVYRTPAWNSDDNHYTYANAFRVNKRIYIPSYGQGNPEFLDEDAEALTNWTLAAGPNVSIIPIDCSVLVTYSGVLHCITMQIPRCTETTPAVHVVSPIRNDFLVSGTTHTIEWTATDTDNAEIPQIDLYYSTDAGRNYAFIDTVTDIGKYNWTVPYGDTDQGKLRIVATSANSTQGEAETEGFFTIAPAQQFIYDFSAGAGEDKYCYGSQTTNWAQIDRNRTPVHIPLAGSDYQKLAYSDATGGNEDPNRYRAPKPDQGNRSTIIFEFTINEDPNEIDDIEVFWEGYVRECSFIEPYVSQIELYIWDYTEGQWSDGEGQFGQNRYMDNWAGNWDGYLDKHIRSNFSRYINPDI